MAKKANHAGGLDRISDLPDSILIRVLSLLPIKYAVSTSILSTRWRYLFASVFNLNVSFNLDWDSPPTVYSFRKFMNKMLFFLTEGRIEQLRLINLDTSSRIDYLPVSGWISAALWRGVMELDLCSSNTLILLPTGVLFSSKTLVRLKLEIPILVSVPTCAFLPSLKTLKLQDITFEDDDSVKRLISRCPILEDLSISNCDMQNITCLTISNPSLKSLTLDFDTDFPDYKFADYKFAVAIDLPTLVYFKYCDKESQNFSIVDMSSLVTADIDISTIHDKPGLVELFEGIRNVKSLHLIIYPEALPMLSHKCFVALENLVQLQIYDTENEWKGMGLFEFLELSPNLQTLELPNAVSFPMVKAPSCLLCKLKGIEVSGFDDVSSLFEMVTYFLTNAKVLAKLTICIGGSLKVEEKDIITEQLLRIPRSSNECQVVIY